MKKLLILAPLLLLTACGNNSGKDAADVDAAEKALAEMSKCKQGPFKNKHELAKLLTEQVYGKPKQVALDMFGRPENVSDRSGGEQFWHYFNYCSEVDEITGKKIVIGFGIVTKLDGTVYVDSEPLTSIITRDSFK